ncbi:MAG TPA: lysophospholipid acyltransferase family protein [Gammaproteobacteria bacterium]|nr:lysophospholipid acyltransferase family protein [Gammaproteobacteria bacterium]
MLFIRSLIFTLFMLLSLVIYATAVLFSPVMPAAAREALPPAWANLALGALRLICRLDYRVEGAENIPDEPGIAFWKHQSMWETIAQIVVFPRQCWVLKKGLMAVPFVGWALRFYQPIAIDRKAGRRAVEQVIEQGQERLAAGRWVMIFPEGTRMPPGATRRYGMSGILLAEKSGRPIVPVAHNAGDFWRRNGILKRPGMIIVRIGKPVYTHGRPLDTVAAEIQTWIETQMKDITPGYAGTVLPKSGQRNLQRERHEKPGPDCGN